MSFAQCLLQAICPKYTATSTMRLEKPHSLSYHDRTRTKRLSSTWVWVTSNTELCGSWLKSTETVGALLIPTVPLSLPFKAGNTSPTALAAPVEVGISDRDAARARRRSECNVSTVFWSPV